MSEQKDAEALAVELHRHNIRKLGPQDVPIAGYPGSGASLIGNILLELGLGYVDPYSEAIGEDGSTTVVPDWEQYRTRLPAMAALDRSRADGSQSTDGAPATGGPRSTGGTPRFFKNHLYPSEYADVAVRGAVVLVRDPRDAVYSSYQWFRGFSPVWMPDKPKAQGDFEDFLDGIGINGEPPIPHWEAFYRTWLDALDGFDASLVITFEDLKADPVGTTSRLLETFGLPVDTDAVSRAAERSSFASMRAHEDRVAGGAGDGAAPRINRRGKVGEWQEWYGDPALAARFQEPELVRTAARYGYTLTP